MVKCILFVDVFSSKHTLNKLHALAITVPVQLIFDKNYLNESIKTGSKPLFLIPVSINVLINMNEKIPETKHRT